MERYEEYKDSHVSWIGSIPKSWSIGRPKYNYYLKGRIGWQGLKSDEFVDNTPYYLVTGTDFKRGRVNWDTCYHITKERFEEAPEIHVKKDDLLVTKDGTIGKVALIDNKPEYVSLNSHLLLMRPTSDLFDNHYLYWIIQSLVFENYYGVTQSGSIMASLSQEKISNFAFPLPSVQEQLSISSYLDKKANEIHNAIDEAKATIEEYKSWKASIIYEAVTKGLDKNVEMKDSGVDWIGKIPKEWELRKLKTFVDIISKGTTPSDMSNAESDEYCIRYIKSENIKNNELIEEPKFYITKKVNESLSRSKLCERDILFVIAGASIGKVAMMNPTFLPANTNQANSFIRIKCRSDMEYLWYILQSNIVKEVINRVTVKSAQPNISMENLGSIKVPTPKTENERDCICQYLRTRIGIIDSLISEKQSLISDLESYKKSLIFETVTGKRKVV